MTRLDREPSRLPLPGDVMLVDTDIVTREGLGRLIARSRVQPLAHVACLRPSMMTSDYHAATAAGPGWLTLIASEDELATLRARPFLERPGIGIHHLGGRWPVAHADVAHALATLFERPAIGPKLTVLAREMGWNATSLGRAIRREAGLPYADLRDRRRLLLMAGLLALDGSSFTAAAQALEWDRRTALRAFRDRGIDWRRFTADGAGASIAELHQRLLTTRVGPFRDSAVAVEH